MHANQDEETFTLELSSTLNEGFAELELHFSGVLNDELRGFYRSAQGDGLNKQYAAISHFEPTAARQAFPCWDEPAFKAVFEIKLVVSRDLLALSNMNVMREYLDEDPSLKVVEFAATPKMSTYLLALVVGKFGFIERRLVGGGTPVRVYMVPGKENNGEFALEVASKILPFYVNYFNVPYGLPKLDLIGVSDFGIGAMENWGLITFRERCLLVNASTSAASTKQHIASVIAHELAHNWFGNLVTMEWWTDLWLKEGFATFIQYLAMDHIFPERSMWTQFLRCEKIASMELDCLSSSHPIEVPVGHPSEISEIFDTISYSKGAAIIRMMHSYVGRENFQTGLHVYLVTHQFGNAQTVDLWDHLEDVSKKPVGRVMSTWTKQKGYPVITVSRQQMSEVEVALKISQRKFSCASSSHVDDVKWEIPLDIETSNSAGKLSIRTLLADPDMVILVSNLKLSDWIKLNPGEAGFYRTCYSRDMLEQLLPAIRSTGLSPVDRLMIQNDMFALCFAGLSSTVEYLELLKHYMDETDSTIWEDIVKNILKLRLLVDQTKAADLFREYVRRLLTPIADKLGLIPVCGEDELRSIARRHVTALLGAFGDVPTVHEFTRVFEDHLRGEVCHDGELRSAVYSTVMVHGDAEVLSCLRKLYASSENADERARLLRCMGLKDDATLRRDVLEFALSDDVRHQDTVLAFDGCCDSLAGCFQSWQFVKSHWQELRRRCAGGFALAKLIEIITSKLSLPSQLEDVKDFFARNPQPNCERTISQACERIQNNIAWLERDCAVVEAWLQHQVSPRR